MRLSRFLLMGGALASLASLENFRLAMDQRREQTAKRSTAAPRKTTWHLAHGKRERDRRVRQNAHQRQLASHMDRHIHSVLVGGKFSPAPCSYLTVKPRHIFGREAEA